jgi:hypothetical protein
MIAGLPRGREKSLRLRPTGLACLALLAAPLAGCGSAERGEVGGIEQMATDSEAALEAARFAAAALDRDGARLARVTSAEHQVRDGLYYYLEIELTDGTRWEVTVWDNPAGLMELTESRQVG